MRIRTWLALIAVAATVAAAAMWQVTRREQAARPVAQTERLFPGLVDRVNDAAAIQFTSAKGSFRISRKTADAWLVEAKDSYPARMERVRKTVLALADIKTIEPRTDNPELYDRIGVGTPGKAGSEALRIELFDDKGGRMADLVVGKAKTGEIGTRPAELYVRKPDESRAWLAEARLSLSPDPLDWLDREIPRIVRDRVASVVIDHANGEKVAISRPAVSAREFVLADIPAGYEVSSQFDIDSIGAALDLVTFDDVRKAPPPAAAKPVVARLATFDGITLTARTFDDAGKRWTVFEAGFDPAKAANVEAEPKAGLLPREAAEKQVADLNARLGGWYFQLPEGRIKDLTRRKSDLVRRPEKKDEKKS